MTMTLRAALSRHDITVADELLAEIEVPIITGPQRQGDVAIIPRSAASTLEINSMELVGRSGVPVIRGEATGNTHLLDAVQGDVRWSASGQGLTLGLLHVGEGSVAHLLHTDEHGCNAIGPGTYRLVGKREMADEIRRVAD
jgi:hypothetical protein